jgi:hypothetical protein
VDYDADMNKYSPLVSEFESEEQEQSYLRWLKTKVAAARADTRPPVPHDEAMTRIRKRLRQIAGKPC